LVLHPPQLVAQLDHGDQVVVGEQANPQEQGQEARTVAVAQRARNEAENLLLHAAKVGRIGTRRANAFVRGINDRSWTGAGGQWAVAVGSGSGQNAPSTSRAASVDASASSDRL